MTDNTDLAAQQAAGLRALADFVENNPGLSTITAYTFDMINAYADTPAEIAESVRAGLAHGAQVTKVAKSDQWFTAVLAWGPVTLHINARREEVCERVQVGESVVTRTIPDPAVEVPMVEVTETVPKYEWRCAPILAADETATAVAS